MIVCRNMRGDDSLAVYALINSNLDGSFSLDTIEYFLALWPEGQFVAEDLFGNIVGVLCGTRLSNGRASMALFAVDSGRRGQGIGTRLFNSFVMRCRMQGFSEIQLELRTGNTKAYNFYSKRGFVITEIVDSLYGPGENGYRMVMRLNSVNHVSS